ncbi:MAG TPA: LysR family transcriptional regulator [Longimicrobium sp.]|jgi:LysR family transcriptional regulator for metE and metH
MGLSLRDLELVAAITDEGSVTRAAQKLYVTQSAASHQLRKLERRVGTALFQRSGRKMTPTPAGARLTEAARETLAGLKRAEEDVKRLVAGRAAVLRISTECYTCYHWLPPVLAALQERFPAVEVHIVAEATRRPVPALLAGKLDLAIVSTPVRDRRLRAFPLFDDELVVVVAPGHPKAWDDFFAAEDFAGEHLITYDLDERDSTVLSEVLRPAGVRPARWTRMQLTEAILELVKAGMGITVLARWAAAPLVESGAVRALPLTAHGFRRRWRALVPRHKTTPPHVAEFARLLVEEMCGACPVVAGD